MLLTRTPLGIATSFDLHVLGTPPAFILSQDQTLIKSLYVLKPICHLAYKFPNLLFVFLFEKSF